MISIFQIVYLLISKVEGWSDAIRTDGSTFFVVLLIVTFIPSPITLDQKLWEVSVCFDVEIFIEVIFLKQKKKHFWTATLIFWFAVLEPSKNKVYWINIATMM